MPPIKGVQSSRFLEEFRSEAEERESIDVRTQGCVVGKVDESLLFSWQNVFSLDILVLLLVAFAVMMVVSLKPKFFWPLLIITNIVGNGPRVKGYFFLDELFTGSIVLGAMLRISTLDINCQRDVGNRDQKLVFGLWVSYMIMQSVVGLVANQDLRIIRWGFFYTLLGLLSAILYHRDREFPFPSIRRAWLIVLITTAVYWVIYLAQGIYFESILEQGAWGRFLSQDMFWAGPQYAAFPGLIAVPAAIFLANDGSLKVRMLAWASIPLMIFVAFYYDCRSLFLVMAGYFFVSLRKIRASYIIFFLLSFSLIFVAFVSKPVENITGFAGHLLKTSQFLWAPGKSDINRNLQVEAGFMRLVDNGVTFFFGDGVHSHRFTMVPYIHELYAMYLPPEDSVIPGSRDDREATIFRTVGFVALLIDIGVVGMLLFSMVFMFVAHKLLLQRISNKMILLMTLFLTFMWLFVSNILDIILLYLLVMPRGLIEQLSQKSAIRRFT